MRLHIFEFQKAEGLTDAETSERFQVGTASLVRWRRTPEPAKKRNRPATKIDMAALARDIKDNPDAYPYERAAHFGVSTSGIAKAIERLGITRKKKPLSS